ncbi:MAG: hotdog fold thioesterase [Pseudomonadota bacterium]
MDTTLPEESAARLGGWFETGIPFHKHLGMRLELAEEGRVVLRIPWSDELVGDPRRPAIHGGVISTIVDAAGGAACFAMLGGPEDSVSTVDLRVDYLRPGTPGDLLCEARIVRMGNRVGVTRSHVYRDRLPGPGDADEPIATGQAVYNVVRRGDRV